MAERNLGVATVLDGVAFTVLGGGLFAFCAVCALSRNLSDGATAKAGASVAPILSVLSVADIGRKLAMTLLSTPIPGKWKFSCGSLARFFLIVCVCLDPRSGDEFIFLGQDEC